MPASEVPVPRGAGPGSITVLPPDGWVAHDDGGLHVPVGREADAGPRTPFFSAVLADPGGWRTLEDVAANHAAVVLEDVDQARLLDADLALLDERPASRVVVAHIVDGADVTLEHWAVPLGSALALVSAQAPTLEFSGLFEAFRDLFAGVTIDA